jgi:hypothetical protein
VTVAAASASLGRVTGRVLIRHAPTVAVVTLVALAPVLLTALLLPAPTAAAPARAIARTTWLLVGATLPCVLLLVGGMAPLARAVVASAPLPHRAALGAGLAGLARAVVPCVLATAAILLGTLALVVPGILLLALFALTGASTAGGLPAPLDDSATVVRAHPGPVALVLVAWLVAVGLAVLALHLRLPAPVPKQPTAAMLSAFRTFARTATLLVVAAAPLVATTLAAIHARARRA